MSTHLSWAVLLAAGISSVFGSGCASVMGHKPAEEVPKPYPGVRMDAEQVGHPNGRGVPAVPVVIMSVIDMPFSAALDTVLLPIDLVRLACHSPEQRDDTARERKEPEH